MQSVVQKAIRILSSSVAVKLIFPFSHCSFIFYFFQLFIFYFVIEKVGESRFNFTFSYGFLLSTERFTHIYLYGYNTPVCDKLKTACTKLFCVLYYFLFCLHFDVHILFIFHDSMFLLEFRRLY